MAEDPDIARGREIARRSATTAAPAAATTDPDIERGRALAGPMPLDTTGPVAGTAPPPGMFPDFTQWTLRGLGRNIGAAGTDVAGNIINVLTDPSSYVVQPLVRAGGFGYDLAAPYFGLPRMTPEQRADLYGQHPEDQPFGTRLVSDIGRVVATDPATEPATPAEQLVRAGVAGAGTAAALGPRGARVAGPGVSALGATIANTAAPVMAGTTGALLGNVAEQFAPDWAKPFAQLVGNVAGASGTGLATTAERIARGAVTDVTSADATLGQIARNKYNIPVTAQDLTNNPLFRIAADQASKLPFSGAAAADAAKRGAWQAAIANEMGEKANAFTPDVLSNARNRISTVFNNVANNTDISPQHALTLVGDLGQIGSDAKQVLGTHLAPVEAQIDNIVNTIAQSNTGGLTGAQYQALTRKGAPLDMLENSSDPNVRQVAGKIRDALDDAFANSAAPADQAALQKARYQWRVMRTVQDLAAGSRDGSISPDAFMQKVLTTSRRFDSPVGGVPYTGGGNMGELARIGKLFRAPPQTGTADRALINAFAFGGPGVLGILGHPYYAAGLGGMLAANRLAGSYLRSGPLANTVIRNALLPQLPSPYAFVPSVVSGTQTPPNLLQPSP